MTPPDAGWEEREAPAFYALSPGGWRDVVTLLHPPYTLLHLSLVALGAGLAPAVRVDRLAAVLAAFFLAVGVAAHFLDELKGRPLRTRLPAAALAAVAGVALAGAVAIGFATAPVSPALLAFVAVGVFAVLAYNLEWWDGRFHGRHAFALFWGAFPFLTGYWAMGESLGPAAFAGAAACYAVALLQHALSTPVRLLRRRVAAVRGDLVLHSGEARPLDREALMRVPERALRLLCVAMPLLALGVLLLRLA